MSNDILDERVAELEARIAFQTETVENLSDMVSAQWKEIDRLKQLVKSLDDQMYDLEQSTGQVPVQKPPHY